MRIRFPVALSVKICFTLSIVLSSYVGGASECLKEYVGFPQSAFLGFPESVCMRSVDGCGTETISVVVITIRLRVVAYFELRGLVDVRSGCSTLVCASGCAS